MVERTLDQTSQEWNVAVDGYEESFEPFTAQFAQEAIRLADIKEGENVLDVAAGPGALTLAAAKAGAKVVAIDFSPQMIHRLRARVQGESLDNVAAHVMDGEALEFLDDTFQVVFSVVGLIFFPDRKKGLDEMFRVLEPGGACGDRGLGIPPKVSFHQFTHALHTADGARFFTQEKSGV